ncbi:MAG: twin-arginine translocase subunit TatC [Dehalococcoidia bacterium]
MTAQQTSPPPEIEEQPRRAGSEMTLIEHLKELRNRVIWCAAALVVGTIFSAVFFETILGWLLAPARESHPELELNVFGPTESIGILFKVAMYGGLVVASPMVIYQTLMFIVPGLTARERRLILPSMLGTIGFLLGGMAFAYWVILPISLDFLIDFGDDVFEPEFGAKQYINFAIRIIFWVGVSFELPMVMALLARLGVARARQFIGFWRYAILLIFIIAAVVTPTPDPLTQSLVAGPLLLLYILGIVFAWILQPRRPPQPSPA